MPSSTICAKSPIFIFVNDNPTLKKVSSLTVAPKTKLANVVNSCFELHSLQLFWEGMINMTTESGLETMT